VSTTPQGMTKPPTKGPVSWKLRVFYALVLLLAFYGQAGGVEGWLIPKDAETIEQVGLWVLVLAFVLVLELGTVVLLSRAQELRHAGEPAAVMIIAATILALGAATLSFVGHWEDNRIQACAFAGITLLGFVIWLFMSDLREQPFITRRRTVKAAVEQFIKDLDLDAKFKKLVMASVDFDNIADAITRGMENDLIAEKLGKAIAPAAWNVSGEEGQEAQAAAQAALRAEFEGIVTAMQAQIGEALGQAAALEKELAQVRVTSAEEAEELKRSLELAAASAATEQITARDERLGELTREVEVLRGQLAARPAQAPVPTGANGSRSNGSAEPVPPQARREVREPVTAPRASAGAAVQAPRAEAAPATVKEQVFELWDGLLGRRLVTAETRAPALADLAESHFPEAKRDSLRRYAGDWRRELDVSQADEQVEESPKGSHLRAVPKLEE